MRIRQLISISFAALVAALALAACGKGGGSQKSLPAVTGTVNYKDRIALSPDAELVVRLFDQSKVNAAPTEIAKKTINGLGPVPIPFSIEYDPKKVDSIGTYSIEALIRQEGQVIFLSAEKYLVLTHGKGHYVDIQMTLARAPTTPKDPKEIVTEQFQQLEQQIGGMTRLTGERFVGDKAIGWDGFLKEGQVRMVRENIDYGEKGRFSVRYAYKNDQPWIVVRMIEGGGQKNVVILQWDDQGQLAFKSKTLGDKKSDPSQEEIDQLTQQAKDAFAAAQKARKDKR